MIIYKYAILATLLSPTLWIYVDSKKVTSTAVAKWPTWDLGYDHPTVGILIMAL